MNTTDTRTALAEQFAQDWLLVAMNDYDCYQDLMGRSGSTSEISEQLREEWDQLVGQVIEVVEENISSTASLFISQILGGQGSLPFDIIAKDIKERQEESR